MLTQQSPAYDRRGGRVVALKLLHSEPSGPHAQERFMREARLLAELEHPGIVAHYDHGVSDDGVHFLAMEWLEGEDLATLLRDRLLTVRAGFRLLERVAAAPPSPTRAGWSTVTSSRATCSWSTATSSSRGCSTSGSPAATRRRR